MWHDAAVLPAPKHSAADQRGQPVCTCMHGDDWFALFDMSFLRLSTMQQISVGSLLALACMAVAALAWLTCPSGR